MENLKVFSIDETDYVAAKSEEEAKTWYEQFIPRYEIEECFEGEVSLDKTIILSKIELTADEEQGIIKVLGKLPEEENFKITLKDWLEVLKPTGEPFIVASTEY